MKLCLSAAIGTATLLLGLTLPASAAQTFTIQVTAATVATVTVTMNSGADVICNPGTALTGIVACKNTVNATGNIRSSKGGTGSLLVMVTVATVTGAAGKTLDISALKMSCADDGSTGTHGAATFARAVPLSSSGTLCALWPGPNIFTYNVKLSFGIDAGRVNADTYSLSGVWTLVAAAT